MPILSKLSLAAKGIVIASLAAVLQRDAAALIAGVDALIGPD